MAPAKKSAAKAKPASNGNITVKLAMLSQPLAVKSIKKGTTLAQFLASNSLEYSSNIRVNAQVAGRETKLKAGDIICVVTQVSGGSR